MIRSTNLHFKFLSLLFVSVSLLFVPEAAGSPKFLRRKQNAIDYDDVDAPVRTTYHDRKDNGSYIGIHGDIVVKKDSIQHRRLVDPYDDTILNQRLLQSNSGESSTLLPNRQYLWETIWPKLDSYKNSSRIWDSITDRPTMSKYHVVVLPVWWDGDDQTKPYNVLKTKEILDKVVDIYKEMSWNKHTITFEIWNRVVATNINTKTATFDNTEKFAKSYLLSNGYKVTINYDGIILVHDPSSVDPLHGGGGWALVNGNFQWWTIPGSLYVARHEFGHNYGHPHHCSNTYVRRIVNDETDLDGFDMMSGGNRHVKSDLAVASKWFYNWVPDSSVVLMQPEGPTTYCPTCVSSVKGMVLSSFDDPKVLPTSSTKMGIHIPISVPDRGSTMFSYWLSYRGVSVGGLASKGLSVHISWLSLGGLFGSTYDSLNYDVFGDTESTRSDSFVIPNTCYVIAPSYATISDQVSTGQIQPIVCVESVIPGISITVNVTFLDVNSPPSATESLTSNIHMACSKSGSETSDVVLDMTNSKSHLLHFNSTGVDGTIDISLCRNSLSQHIVRAYFYDSYPYSYVSLNSPAGYGAYRSLNVTHACTNPHSLSYKSHLGEVYVLIKNDVNGIPGDVFVTFNSKCALTSCSVNNFMSTDGTCVSCPESSVSPAGSNSSSACYACNTEGWEMVHPKINQCVLPSKSYPNLSGANEWRLFTTSKLTVRGWVWDVIELSFYSSQDCSDTSKIQTIPTNAFDSGNAFGQPWNSTIMYSPSKAFDNKTSLWGGRRDKRDYFWIGMTFQSDVNVRCVSLEQSASLAKVVYIQARQSGEKTWRNVWIASNLTQKNFIPFTNYQTPSSQPTANPTSSPTSSPSNRPVTVSSTSTPTNRPVTLSPTSTPTSRPVTLSPTSTPTSRPVTLFPTLSPTSHPVTLPPTSSPTNTPVTLSPTSNPTLHPVTSPPTFTPTGRPVTAVPSISFSTRVSCKQRCRKLFFIFRKGFQMHKITQIGCIEKCFRTIRSGTSKGYVCGKCPR